MTAPDVAVALDGLDLRCENYVDHDGHGRMDGCRSTGRSRSGPGYADRWCLPCEVRARLHLDRVDDGVSVGRWHHHRCLLLDRAHGGACIVPPDDDPLVPAGPPRTPRGPRSFRPMHFGHAHRVLARRDRLVRRWLDRTGAAWSEALAGGDAMRRAAWGTRRHRDD